MQHSDDNSQTIIIEEIQELRTKIRHVRESIQLSTNIAQPPIWRDNCLNATANIVNQWRSIVSYYTTGINIKLSRDRSSDIEIDKGRDIQSDKNYKDEYLESLAPARGHPSEESVDDIIVSSSEQYFNSALDQSHPLHSNHELCKETACQVFGLIQLSLQSGPLKGSNAGYFKRCGPEIARLAITFLHKCIDIQSDEDDSTFDSLIGNLNIDIIMDQLRFSLKQKDAVEKWISYAEKAVTANKPPSKSALKLQSSVNTKGMNKNKKKNKNKLVRRL